MCRISFRALKREDLSSLVDWINCPHVARWWDGPVDAETISDKYLPRLADDSITRVFVIEASGQAIGIIQYLLFSEKRPVSALADVDV